MIGKAIRGAIDFFGRQEKPFKVNLARAGSHYFLSSLSQQYQSIYVVGLGATPLQLGLVNSMGGIAQAGISMPSGWLADRWGIRKMFLLGTPLMALGALIFALAPDWTITVPAIFVTMLSMQWVNTACPMVCGSYLKDEERATGMQLCDTLSAVPGLISPIAAAMIITGFGGLNTEGIRPLYYLQVVGFALIFVFISKQYVDTLKRGSSKSSTGFVSEMREVFARGTRVRIWIAITSLSTASMFMSSTYLSVFAAEVKHADQFVLGGMATASMLAPLTLSLLMGRLADTIGRKRVIYLTTPLYCLSVVLLIYAPDTTTLLVSGALQGFFVLSGVTQAAMTAELMPIPLLGRWYGVLGVFRGLANVIGPIIGGLVWSIIGPVYVFVLIVLIQVLRLIVLRFGMPETLRVRPSSRRPAVIDEKFHPPTARNGHSAG